MSTGLAYAPMTYSGHRELVALTREVAKRGGLFSIHMRSYADKIAEAVEESLGVCAESGARLQISHYMVNGTANRGRADELLGWIEKGRGRGVDVSFDAYPYTAGSTVVQMCLPEWAQAGGPDKLLERLRDDETRARVIADLRQSKSIEWDKSFIAGVKTSANGRYVGMNFPSAAELAGIDLHEFICRLLVEEDLEVSHVVHMGSEPDMRVIMRHPAHSFGSDGLHFEGRPHPRLYGCFPRVLGRYVREDKVLTLEQAIHKMTGHNAARLGFRDRGVIAAGKAADVVVFDPETIMDRATYEEPRQYPEGIRLVMVNGDVVVRDGTHSGTTPGRVTGRLM
jgi:N-acyl-D-amino-acid deacylase